MAELSIPFAIGETVWHATCASSYVEYETCPECAGTKALTLIRGNGESVSLQCNYCQRGYGPSFGVIERRVSEYTPRAFVCASVVSWDGKEINYSEAGPDETCRNYAGSKDLFRSREECEARCAERNAQSRADDERRAIANLASKRASLAHSVHYWGNKIKALERDLEVARGQLAVCKQKPARVAPADGEVRA
jgi:hypothetical protein